MRVVRAVQDNREIHLEAYMDSLECHILNEDLLML